MLDRIAREMSEGVIIADWKYALVLAFLLILGSFIGGLINSWARGYGSQSGKIKSIDKNLSLIQKQLKQSTEMTEQIKSQIEHDGWRKKEKESIRRQKLEEFMQLVHMLPKNYSNAYTNQKLGRIGENFDQFLIDKIRIIQSLYFPELLRSTCILTNACIEFSEWLLDGNSLKIRALKSGQESDSGEHDEKYLKKLRSLHSAISETEKDAVKVAEEINIK